MIRIYTRAFKEKAGESRRQTEHELGRALLKTGLMELFGLKLESQVMASGIHGKPYFPQLPHVHFNISHCEGLAACAVSDRPVGMDVEKKRGFRPATARKVLAEGELRYLESCPEKEQPKVFLQYWTLKESYVKAEGCGISLPLSQIEFDLSSLSSSKNRYQFFQVEAGDYVLSVCAEDITDLLFMPEGRRSPEGMGRA